MDVFFLTCGNIITSMASYKQPTSDLMEDALVLVERSRRPNKIYNAEEITFRARVDPEKLPQDVRRVSITAVVDSVQELFRILIRRTTEHLNSSDLIRFCILAEGLDKPISTCLMPVSTLTLEKLRTAVMKVLQSKDYIELDVGFAVDVITVKRSVGAGRTNRKVLKISVDRLRKQAILAIPYDDEGLCCAKAMVYALAHLNQDRTAMKKRDRPALMNRARDLHAAAGVPLGFLTSCSL